MGHEMCGELVEGGDASIHPGDRVIVDPVCFCGKCPCCLAGHTHICPNGFALGRDADGGFAEFMTAPRSQIFPLPDAVENRQAPIVQVATTCVHAQRRVNIFPGQAVVVMGLGVSGQIHVQLAKARGAHPVIGVTRSAWKRSLAEKLGADITLPSGAEAERAVLDLTDGHGAGLIIDTTSTPSVIASAIRMARWAATLLLFGITTGTEASWPFYQLYFKELTLVNARAAKSEDFPATFDLIASGALKLEPLITHVLPLAQLEKALAMLDSDTDERMKIILDNTC